MALRWLQLHRWHYLDWAFVFLNFVPSAFEEGRGAGYVKGYTVLMSRASGVVPVVGWITVLMAACAYFCLDADHEGEPRGTLDWRSFGLAGGAGLVVE